jgi:hypothetical protein
VKIVAGGLEQVQEVRSGGSYLSQNDFRLHFGLGAAVAINRIEIHWPSGAVQKLTSQKSDSLITIREP